jgi:hypothetical protein
MLFKLDGITGLTKQRDVVIVTVDELPSLWNFWERIICELSNMAIPKFPDSFNVWFVSFITISNGFND